ncbi:MAG: hypothetical protein A2176_12195 [Spirochaetes bacterium RBG_13_51_14]|nr:MAG: hypothetical protein A2176_12195 [Spirochaetes bacterium RBG_13_51_14]
MSQLTEVGREQQARTEAVVEQQHMLEKESGEKARLVNTKLDESKKGESAVIHDQQKKEEKKREQAREGHEAGGRKAAKKGRSSDDRMGNIVDILK